MARSLVFVMVAFALFASGCSDERAPVTDAVPTATVAPSRESTEALPGGGVRTVGVQGDVRITAELTSVEVPTRDGVRLSLTLANEGADPVHWTEDLLVGAAAGSEPGEEGYTVGLGWRPIGQPAVPQTLELGESESRVVTIPGLPPGEWWVWAAYQGSGGPSGQTPPVLVVVTP